MADNHKKHRMSMAVAIGCAAMLSVVSFQAGNAAGTTGKDAGASQTHYNSQGIMKYTNNNADASDDVIFDSDDFIKIDNAVTSGKNSLTNILNTYAGHIKTYENSKGLSGEASSVQITTSGSTPATFEAIANSLNNLVAPSGKYQIGNADLATGPDVSCSYFKIPAGYYSGSETVKMSNSNISIGESSVETASAKITDGNHSVVIPVGYVSSQKEVSVDWSGIINAIKVKNGNVSSLSESSSVNDIITAIQNIPTNITVNNIVNGKISYTYHDHSNCYYLHKNCYHEAEICPGHITNRHTSACNDDYDDGDCSVCGRSMCARKGDSSACGKVIRGAYYECGHRDGEIVEATIVF